ncbi:P-loop containing nucleoside triphosphate hydrolase protein [Rozella allomycis CSF55]|uniref:P-loop containing nucleoside triphosphate hydrolase protein n=1 Tax=Rozella allomycis (strain CSF55) TaxID=988480 RepID=A0A4V1IZM1_ROZAC|nr:P-loop containing nucleoside triphosphate hydrolase protein [Rozella allomycis CSF55]
MKTKSVSLHKQIEDYYLYQDDTLLPILLKSTMKQLISPTDLGQSVMLVKFLTYCFGKIDNEEIRPDLLKMCSVGIWRHLSGRRLELELEASGARKRYNKSVKDADERCDVLKVLCERVYEVIGSEIEGIEWLPFVEHVIVLFNDLLSQLPTRKYVRALVDDLQFCVRVKMSPVFGAPEAMLLRQLHATLCFYVWFPVDEYSGEGYSEEEQNERETRKVVELQKLAFSKFKEELEDLALSNIGEVRERDNLQEILVEVIVQRYERKLSQMENINDLSLYPDEEILFNDQVTIDTGDEILPVPKLTLQYLSFHDYLMRNFHLFRMHSLYDVRMDVEDVVSRMRPTCTTSAYTEFTGWSRMALPIHSFKIMDVGKARVGESKPGFVCAEVSYSVSMLNDTLRREWESIRQNEVLLLLSIQATPETNTAYSKDKSFKDHYGITMIRGCEVYEKAEDESEEKIEGYKTVKVYLDVNQYDNDLKNGRDGEYSMFNLVMRRKPRNNNYKGALSSIRELMKKDIELPEWSRDIILGYGDPNSVKIKEEGLLNFCDTFVDESHLIESFKNEKVAIHSKEEEEGEKGYILNFKEKEIEAIAYNEERLIREDFKPRNEIRFTENQVEAIRSGMNKGMTLIVGPPGTGKTDVCVQMIYNLYKNYPNQKIVVLTHSNQALDSLFKKISEKDVLERHLLRLGSGQDELKIEEKYSQLGRVDYFMNKKNELLKFVDELAKSLSIPGDHGFTCETAVYFYLYYIKPLIIKFNEKIKDGNEDVEAIFPFKNYFNTSREASEEAITSTSTTTFTHSIHTLNSCINYIERKFNDLEHLMPFETLKTKYDRNNYLLMKEARIIAMTCTFASLKRQELIKYGFKYDSVIIEEAGQVSEIESFIPLVLQDKDDMNRNHLKRIILIGDHNQLPPIIRHRGLQSFSNMELSLFYRLIRLGVPFIQLNSQGRCRPSIANLFNWRYNNLLNLNHVNQGLFTLANPGFAFEYQFINVEDYQGKGETEPIPHFIQNLGEAEYIVAVYQYMRLIGYPKDKITILTSYLGQKELIKDVLKQRCGWTNYFGIPHVSTIDKFQDILLSLVKTKSVGHLKDLKRLTVALSRARLGLYIFGRQSIFQQWKPFSILNDQLFSRPTNLVLNKNETTFETNRLVSQTEGDFVVNLESLGSFVYEKSKSLPKNEIEN